MQTWKLYARSWSPNGLAKFTVDRERESILSALDRAGWQLDDEQPERIEASDGQRYGVAVFFDRGGPVEICYGDGVEDLQFCEAWTEAPGILASEEVARLFSDEEGEQG
jgi:hypothetical protein